MMMKKELNQMTQLKPLKRKIFTEADLSFMEADTEDEDSEEEGGEIALDPQGMPVSELKISNPLLSYFFQAPCKKCFLR